VGAAFLLEGSKMNKEYFRLFIGISVIAVHFVCLVFIMNFNDNYLSHSEKISMALLFMPVTAAYVCAIIKSAIDRANEKNQFTYVNINYASIVSLFTICTLGGLLWIVFNLEGAQVDDRQAILLYETAFGAGFGLICADLFGKAS